MTAPPDPAQDREAKQLVFALCHEIGNLVAAVQLEADLLGDVDRPRELAASAVKIEDLCARVGGLLGQVRPLLADATPSPLPGADAEAIVAAANAQLEWRGSGHAEVRCEAEAGLPALSFDADSLRELLLALAYAALDEGGACSLLTLQARSRDAGVAFSVADDGAVDDALLEFRETARSGRALLCRIAESLLQRAGGTVSAQREGGLTRVELWLPGGLG
jgi:C4-dicarboxylate-specific signal transduction histidine kinase